MLKHLRPACWNPLIFAEVRCTDDHRIIYTRIFGTVHGGSPFWWDKKIG